MICGKGGAPVGRIPGSSGAAGRRRVNWYRNYLDAQVQRDVPEIARIRSLDALPRLLTLAAARTAALFNRSELAAPFQISRPTIRDYVTLLEGVFLLEQLSPWHSDRLKRLVKTPKLHLGDIGLACALLGIDAAGLAADRKRSRSLVELPVEERTSPIAARLRSDLEAVYPRVCGGNDIGLVCVITIGGPSPRVRGNPRRDAGPVLAGRSIPACAGEPTS